MVSIGKVEHGLATHLNKYKSLWNMASEETQGTTEENVLSFTSLVLKEAAKEWTDSVSMRMSMWIDQQIGMCKGRFLASYNKLGLFF